MGLDKSKPDWLLPGVIIALSVLIALGSDMAREALRYDRVWLGQGEAWRLISAHVVHLGWKHLLLNCVGLILVWFLIGSSYSLNSWLLVLFGSMLCIDVAFWLLNPELYWYVGMSGVLHGLLAAAIVARWQWAPLDPETTLLGGLLIAKLGWEQFAGPVPGSVISSGGPVIVDAHFYGAIGGVLMALIIKIRAKGATAI